jgi:glycosyltransferase involved in cell wall biosynthesis
MRVFQVHNEYQYPGGEEAVVEAEYNMLKSYGHEIKQWVVNSSTIKNSDFFTKTKLSFQSIWSMDAYVKMKKHLEGFHPDVVHIHNTIPLLTPSIYAACHDSGVPVVQTLHNYKFICPGSNLYRNERICEQCVGKTFTYPALIYGCYRRDHLSTFFSVTSLTFNRLWGTYQNHINIYIALTEFARQKFIEGGLPAEKIVVKPNFISSEIKPGNHTGRYALFAGRLIPQKGIETLLKAWHLLDEIIPLKIVGRGSLETLMKGSLPSGVEYLGAVPRTQVLELMQNASFLVFPSEWYEGFPIVIAEAFATGLPVVASRLGGMAEIIQDGRSGWHFNPGDPQDLARVVKLAWSDPVELERQGTMAYQHYKEHFSAEKNYQMILDIYQAAIAALA